MQKQKYSRDEFLEMFKQDVIRLSKYIPWLEDKSGDDVSKNYQDGNKMDHTLSFPVYDSILLAFLNDASTTVFMEKNYQYFYTKNHIYDYQDELAMIERADIMHMDILQCILSRYVFGGMVKAYLWKAGVDHKIFVTVIKKARQIVEFWSEPLVIEDEIPAEGYPEEFTYPEVDEADWTDEEFAAVLSGELNAEDIPRLRWEKEHATAGVGNDEAVETVEAVEAEIKEVVLPADFVFPEVDDADWTDEEFAAVLAGELDPNDIPRMHYEKEHGVKVVFGEPGSEAEVVEEAEQEPIESQESETESESESMETQKPEIEPELPEEPEIEPELPEEPEIEPELPEKPEIEPELPEKPDIEPELPEKPEIEPEPPEKPDIEPELPEESDIESEQEAVAVAESDDEPDDETVTKSKPIESSEETTPEQETEVPETDSDGETGALE